MARQNGKNGKPTPDSGQADAECLARMQQDAGKGMEDIKSDDLGLPWFRLLQKGSPECSIGDPSNIEGAREGMWLDSISRALYSSLIVIPAKSIKHYVEWKPRSPQGGGGGFVKNFGGDRVAYDKAIAGRTGFRGVTQHGTEIIPTGTWFCFVVSGVPVGSKTEEPIMKRGVFTFASTGMKVSNRWAGEAYALKLKGTDGKTFTPALFASSWRMTSTPQKNASGSWMLPQVTRDLWVEKMPNATELYEQGRSYAEFANEYHARITYPQAQQPQQLDAPAQREPGDDGDEDTPF